MCDEKIRLSNIASTINATPPPGLTQDQLIARQAAANLAVAEHVATCQECQERRRLEMAAIRRMIDILEVTG